MVAAAAMGFSCTQMGDSLLLGGMSAAAKDQIMLVRQEPPSFGYQRLATQTVVYPDLGIFVSQHGVPNFLAETGNSDRRYFILYYLNDREAFACRTRSGRTAGVEFAGPYPITDREFKLLDGFRRDSSRRTVKF
jgi:hypothetical protein